MNSQKNLLSKFNLFGVKTTKYHHIESSLGNDNAGGKGEKNGVKTNNFKIRNYFGKPSSYKNKTRSIMESSSDVDNDDTDTDNEKNENENKTKNMMKLRDFESENNPYNDKIVDDVFGAISGRKNDKNEGKSVIKGMLVIMLMIMLMILLCYFGYSYG